MGALLSTGATLSLGLPLFTSSAPQPLTSAPPEWVGQESVL